MGKFGALMKNEYIKMLRSLSTKIMLIILAVAVVGLAVLMKVALLTQDEYGYDSDYDINIIEEVNSNIEFAKESNQKPGETDLKLYNFLQDNNITSSDDWRAVQLSKLYETNLVTEDTDKTIEALKANDWKSFCEYAAENINNEAYSWEYDYRAKNDISFDDEEKSAIINKITKAKINLAEGTDNNKPAKDNIIIGEYQLENNVYTNAADYTNLMNEVPDKSGHFWYTFFKSSYIVYIVSLLMIIQAGGTVATEFSQGTIKFLLINPVKRWKILMSKYATCLTFCYILIALVFILAIPVNGILNGFQGIGASYLYVKDGTVHSMSPFLYVAKTYLLRSVNTVVMMTLAFALSSLVRKSALAIGVSVFTMMIGSSVTSFMASLDLDWGKYLIFANTDLESVIDGSTLFPGQTLTFTICVIAAHMVVFLLTAWDGFTKKSI